MGPVGVIGQALKLQVTPKLLESPPTVAVNFVWVLMPRVGFNGATVTVTLDVIVAVAGPDLEGSATEVAVTVACDAVARIIAGAV